MKHLSPGISPVRDESFSALGRAVWDETGSQAKPSMIFFVLSVLSVEPYGMKHQHDRILERIRITFSALGRAVWDETCLLCYSLTWHPFLSVLSVEPYGMKLCCWPNATPIPPTFSALGRAVWDETDTALIPGDVLLPFQCSRSSRMG